MTIPFQTGVLVSVAELNVLARAHWRKTTEKDVVNTVTKTDLLNGEITIDAGAMSTNRGLYVCLVGDYLNNSAANRTLGLEIALGGTVLYSSNGANIAVSANRRVFAVEFSIINRGSASSQWLKGGITLGTATAPSGGTGISDYPITTALTFTLASDMGSTFPFGGSGAVDTSTAKALTVSVTHSAANASLSCRCEASIVEVV